MLPLCEDIKEKKKPLVGQTRGVNDEKINYSGKT